MSEKRLQELISELLQEMGQTPSVSEDTVALARQLEAGIQDLVNPEVDSTENTVLDDAIALEASFAATHPVAEKILRELINTLSRIGI